MYISFEHEGVKYDNWDIEDIDVRNMLKKRGIDVLAVTKKAAYEKINSWVSQKIKAELGGTYEKLDASNSKAITLVAKVLNELNPALDGLTDLEKDSWQKMIVLAESGYSDSELLNSSLIKVSEYIAAGTDKAARVASANSIEEVIAILNEA